MGLLIPLFWTSGDICPGFQSQGGFPHLCASSPVHNGFLRFTSGATPADCIEVSIAAKPFWSTYLWALVEVWGLEPTTVHAARTALQTTRPLRLGWKVVSQCYFCMILSFKDMSSAGSSAKFGGRYHALDFLKRRTVSYPLWINID